METYDIKLIFTYVLSRLINHLALKGSVYLLGSEILETRSVSLR